MMDKSQTLLFLLIGMTFPLLHSSYPLPSCNGNNEGEFQPVEECGDMYYICIGGNIYFQVRICIFNEAILVNK